MSKFLLDDEEGEHKDGAKAKAIPRVFSENSRAKNVICLTLSQTTPGFYVSAAQGF